MTDESALAAENLALRARIAELEKSAQIDPWLRALVEHGPAHLATADVTDRVRLEAAVNHARDLFQTIFENANVGIATTDATGRVTTFNETFRAMLGYDSETLLSMNFGEFTHPEDLERESVYFAEVLENRRDRYHMEKRYRASDGRLLWVDIFVSVIRRAGGDVECFVGVVSDISARKQAEAALRDNEAQLSAVFENIDVGVALVALEPHAGMRVLNINRYLLGTLESCGVAVSSDRVSGRQLEEVLRDVLHLPEDRVEEQLSAFRAATETGSSQSFEAALPRANATRYLDTSVSPIRDASGRVTHILWTGRDITDKRDQEKALRTSLAEKEVLLREIHHRVKNNFQVISSLLSLQSGEVEGERLREAFTKARGRIRTMALVHERLYQSTSLSALDFGAHLEELVEMIVSAQPARAIVDVHREVESVELDLSVAIPLALIAHELLTNAVKHAYVPGPPGRIAVRCRPEGGHLTVAVSDQGKGLPRDFDASSGATLGFKLVSALAAQIDADVGFESGAGTTVSVTVPLTRRSSGPPALLR